MRRRSIPISALIVGIPLLSGCAGLQAGYRGDVSARIEQAVGVAPSPASQTDVQRKAAIDELLKEPLTPQAAAQIAVANNPKVRLAFAQMGVGYADLLEGIMPANPSLHYARMVLNNGEADILKYGLGFNLMSLITLPSRQRASGGYFQAAKANATGQTLMVAGAARVALIEYVAAKQKLDLLTQANEASQAALLAAEAIYAAGNSTRLDVDRERLFAAEMGIGLRMAQAQLVPAFERVNTSLGLEGEQTRQWEAISRLPAPPETAVDAAGLEERVTSASTDIAQATGMVNAARAARGASGFTSLFSGLELSAEQERDGATKRGGGIGVILPIFGLGHPARLRATSTLDMEQARLSAVNIDLRSEARTAVATAEAMRLIAIDRREVILPLSASVFSGTQLNFNAMQIGIFQLLQAKRLRLDAGQAAIKATRDYWVAQANLDLLLSGGRAANGGAMDGSANPAPSEPPGH